MDEKNYLERMEEEKKTDHPCANCLRDTEEMIKGRDFQGVCAGDRLWYETYAAETDEFTRALREYAPQRVLDVGSGYGRVVDLIAGTLPQAEVVGTEINEPTQKLAEARFRGNSNVRVELADVVEFLSRTNERFDMATCLMNTFGNINDENLFMEILKHSDYFVFTLYNPEHDERRGAMYEARCHLNFSFDGRQYNFTDPWTNVTVSKSYSKEEIEGLVEKAGAEIVELKEVGILYFCVAKNQLE